MDRERLSGGCLLALSLTALMLCSRLHGAEGQPAVIDVAPQAQTAPLGSNVTFECRGNHDIYFVLNDSFPLNQEANRRDLATPRGIFTEYPENPLVNRLFVAASLENNRSILIHCSSDESALNNARSVSVALTVFGLPLAPTDLTVVGGSLTEVELSWVAPFTQAGENVTYTVQIANQETGFSTSRPSEETELTFADPGSPVCSRFTYMVFTENAAGTSESPSNIVSKAFPTGPGTVDDVTIAVSLAGSPSATLTFQTPTLCEDFPPSNYTVTLTTGGSSDQQGPFPASGGGGATQVVALTVLEEDALYVATVTTANPFGSTTSTEFEFYTTDLQQLVVFSTSSRLVITCTLATGSDALGCNVMARPEGDPTPFWSVNLMRSDSDLELMMTFLLSEVDPPPGSFLIFASDLEADGSIGELQLSAEIQPTPRQFCPGETVSSFSCTAVTAHVWAGSALDGQCPSGNPSNGISLTTAANSEGDTATCGIFSATVTNIMGGMLSSTISFTASSDLDGTDIVCRNATPAEVVRYPITIIGPPTANITMVNFILPRQQFVIKWDDTAVVSDGDVTGFQVNSPSAITCEDTSSSPSAMESQCSWEPSAIGQTHSICVSAINCGSQQGPNGCVNINLQVPEAPTLTACPVYDQSGPLLRIESSCTTVPAVNIAAGVDGSPDAYIFSYNDGDESVVSSGQCTGGTCTDEFTPDPAVSQYTVSVTARNVVGEGPPDIARPFNTMNNRLGLTIDTDRRKIECMLLSGFMGSGTTQCQIIYGTDASYNNLAFMDTGSNTSTTITVTLTATLQARTTYYYIATATSGNECARLQSSSSFTTGLSVGATVGITVVPTFLAAFSAGLLVAFAIAYCYIRQRKSQYSPRDPQQPTPTQASISVQQGNIELKDNIAYGPVPSSSQPPAPQQRAPMYEEVVTHVQPGSIEMKANVAYGPISH